MAMAAAPQPLPMQDLETSTAATSPASRFRAAMVAARKRPRRPPSPLPQPEVRQKLAEEVLRRAARGGTCMPGAPQYMEEEAVAAGLQFKAGHDDGDFTIHWDGVPPAPKELEQAVLLRDEEGWAQLGGQAALRTANFQQTASRVQAAVRQWFKDNEEELRTLALAHAKRGMVGIRLDHIRSLHRPRLLDLWTQQTSERVVAAALAAAAPAAGLNVWPSQVRSRWPMKFTMPTTPQPALPATAPGNVGATEIQRYLAALPARARELLLLPQVQEAILRQTREGATRFRAALPADAVDGLWQPCEQEVDTDAIWDAVAVDLLGADASCELNGEALHIAYA